MAGEVTLDIDMLLELRANIAERTERRARASERMLALATRLDTSDTLAPVSSAGLTLVGRAKAKLRTIARL